jgi:hypothetical protein
VANESGINFISVKGPELLNMVSHLVTYNHTGFAVEQEFIKMAGHFVTILGSKHQKVSTW